jgi:hypothetical protein
MEVPDDISKVCFGVSSGASINLVSIQKTEIFGEGGGKTTLTPLVLFILRFELKYYNIIMKIVL